SSGYLPVPYSFPTRRSSDLFCETSELTSQDGESIFKFIEKNKFTLSRYISNNRSINGDDFTAEAQFISFFRRIPSIYEKIKNIRSEEHTSELQSRENLVCRL